MSAGAISRTFFHRHTRWRLLPNSKNPEHSEIEREYGTYEAARSNWSAKGDPQKGYQLGSSSFLPEVDWKSPFRMTYNEIVFATLSKRLEQPFADMC